MLFLQLEAGLDSSQLQKCRDVVQSFIVRRAVTGEETKEYNKLFVEVVGALRGLQGSDVRPALEAKLLSGGGTTRLWPTDEQVIESAVTASIYGRLRPPALRVILERLELSFRGKKTENDEIQPGLQVEHIMPQTWATYWTLNGETVGAYHASYPFMLPPEQESLAEAIRGRNIAVNSLGNLTLLNEYLNPAASNGTFALKCDEYRHSVMQLNRYFDGATAWDESAIRKRGRKLGEALCRIWPRAESSAA